MFLVGGPAFSGTTLLALLLNQDGVVCLDEPDFHNPEQSHRGIPILARLFPDRFFPERPVESLTYPDAVRLIERCHAAIQPIDLGIKTCNWVFMNYAREYRRKGYPVIAIVRDIRDAMVRELPEWVDEHGLNERYRLIWRHRHTFDLWIRYEDLVADPGRALRQISGPLGRPLAAPCSWNESDATATMLKLDRHELLRTGRISSARVGIWRNARPLSRETHETARMMGYGDSPRSDDASLS